MKPSPIFSPDDEARILVAIQEAEGRTTGEIRLCVSEKSTNDATRSARDAFQRLAMHQTRQRNGVLLYLAPKNRVFAIVGDQGIHEQCGDAFWTEIAQRLSAELAAGNTASGIITAIQEIGTALGRHFPRSTHDTNELPNAIARD